MDGQGLTREQQRDYLEDRFRATILGGAIGDALGYSVEFMSRTEILARFGGSGITDLQLDKRIGKALISDDTQMTLFTAEGLLWAHSRNDGGERKEMNGQAFYPSYLRWHHTQQRQMSDARIDEWLVKQPYETDFSLLDQESLYAGRAPGNTCLTALGSGSIGTIDKPLNKSKGCGGVMRVAPVGLFFYDDPESAFRVGAEAAAVTHGHPSAYLSAGAFAAIIAELVNGKELTEGIDTALWLLRDYRHYQETSRALEKAMGFARSAERPEEVIPELGEGWVADEALSIALYCALKRKDFRPSLILAVNHSGDSDSTGAICGNLLGAYGGIKVIPENWLEGIEMREVMEKVGARLVDAVVGT